MNNIGVVLLAFLGGIFLIVVVLAVAGSLWAAWDVRRQAKAMLLASESGKGIFQSIRSDVAKSLEAQGVRFDSSLKAFDETFKTAIKNLNGKALLQAAEKNIVAMRRLDEVALALHELVTAAGESAGTSREWQEVARADEHAPQEASRISKSIYAQDQIDEQEAEAAFNVATNGAGDLFQ